MKSYSRIGGPKEVINKHGEAVINDIFRYIESDRRSGRAETVPLQPHGRPRPKPGSSTSTVKRLFSIRAVSP
ncbi:MAG: hypothetical protein LH609_13275 [Rudanella sp.]|nr:hypothetical protein [Rudanella sp.]